MIREAFYILCDLIAITVITVTLLMFAGLLMGANMGVIQ